jgi:D-alanine-D-alanine ligase
MKIGLSYDLKEAVDPGQKPQEDALEEYDSKETIAALKSAIEAYGHTVVKLGGGRDFLNHILREKVDFVFNISEGLGTYRGREAQVPSVLEMLDIPYSGADPQCMAICLDKHLTKKIVSWEGVHTPIWRTIGRSQLNGLDWQSLPYPALVKPVWEGSSKGIRQNSICRDPQQMETLVTGLLESYSQPVLVEEFIPGQEVTVGIIGNDPPQVMGMMKIAPRQKDRNFIYSIEVKRDYENLVDYECPPKIRKPVLEQIKEFSLQAFQVLECRDFARLDFRIRPNGDVYFLEANPLAGLNPKTSDLVIMAGLLGISYQDLIGSILKAALKRYPQCALK